jgi:hypothetical protein
MTFLLQKRLGRICHQLTTPGQCHQKILVLSQNRHPIDLGMAFTKQPPQVQAALLTGDRPPSLESPYVRMTWELMT